MDNSKCIILVPSYAGVSHHCEDSLRALERQGYHVWRCQGVSAIDQARNLMAQTALNRGYEELMWIDDDIGFDPSAVARLRKHRFPISAGIYALKDGSGRPCVDPADDTDYEKELTPVRYAATGFLYTKAQVYKAIREKLNLPQCSARFGKCYPYFLPMVYKDRRYLGEDYAFCERAIQAGFRVMADTTIWLRHFGTMAFQWQNRTMQALPPDKVPKLPVIFSVVDNADLLPHFVRHYLAQGCNRFICCLHGEDNPLRSGVIDTLKRSGAEFIVETVPASDFNGKLDSEFQDWARQRHVRPEEWYVVADLDEMHVVEGFTLAQAAAQADYGDCTAIAGVFRDRITADGSLPERLRDDASLAMQFPWQAQMTAVVTGGATKKVLCARGDVPIQTGHHNHSGIEWSIRGWADHFKWWGGLHAKAKARAQSYDRMGLFWSAESHNLVRYLDSNGGKINVAEERLKAGPCPL